MSAWIPLDSKRLRIRISPCGGAVVDAYTVEGVPFLRPCRSAVAFDVKDSACFPLVPIANRVEGNAFSYRGRTFTFARNTNDPLYIHGDGWQARWDVREHRADSVELAFSKPEILGSPYAYQARQWFRVADARFELQLSVTNTGRIDLPFGIGFHPFFPLTPQTTLLAPATAWWTERDAHLPGSRGALVSDADFSTARRLPDRWLNNCFEGWNGSARIVWPERQLGVDIAADSMLDRYMLFAPNGKRDFFCLEPMSHSPNALKHFETEPMGLALLSPGDSLRAGFAMTVFDWSEAHG